MSSSPWIRWALGEEHRDLDELYMLYLQLAVHLGNVWATPSAEAVACWTHSEQETDVGAFLSASDAPPPTERERQAAALLAPHAPRAPHWRLAAVAVTPRLQARGLGTTVLGPQLATCDATGTLATLETSTPDNVRFYKRLGFAITAELDIPTGPRTWLMQRQPRRH